jgi:hypothetical protein
VRALCKVFSACFCSCSCSLGQFRKQRNEVSSCTVLTWRCRGWMHPVLFTRTEDIYLSAGMDVVVLLKTIEFGIQFFVPLAFICLTVCMPQYLTFLLPCPHPAILHRCSVGIVDAAMILVLRLKCHLFHVAAMVQWMHVCFSHPLHTQ